METEEMILVGVVEVQEAKRLKSVLAERKVTVELAFNPETCKGSGGCAATVEVYVPADAVEAFKTFVEEEHARIAAHPDALAGSRDHVFDAEKSTAQCPACGTEFSTSLTECPDCGLGFGVSER
jgi:hypothetical protein